MMNKLDADFAALGATLRRSIVRVHDAGGRGSGSGVVWDARGTVVTNAHVVRGRSATVELERGTRVQADVLQRDDAHDLAALRIPLDVDAAPATVRDSATLAPGELVVAVGNPLGLVGALTAGLVQRSNARFIVADVKLEPGNSGGALADSLGRVVGINSMVARGLALAVPSSAVAAFLGSAAAPRRLGARLVPVVTRVDGRRIAALLVTAVDEGSVAQRAGLALGDAVVVPESSAPLAAGQFAAALAGAAVLDVVRGGKRLSIALPQAWGDSSRAA